jgi:hypothetical protein
LLFTSISLLAEKLFFKEIIMNRVLCLFTAMAFIAILSSCSSDNSTTDSTPSPHASFTMTGTRVTPALISFVNTSQNADHYQWDFGDGRSSIQASPEMTFDTHGDFEITLIAFPSSLSRSDTARQVLSITPSRVFLDSLRVEQIPFVDGNGAGWDLTTGPDLIFELSNGAGVLISSSSHDDLSPSSLPVGWYFSPEYQIQEWGTNYDIDLYDYDAGSANDFIGGFRFTINGLISSYGYASSVVFRNSQQTIRIALALRWQ